MHTSLLGGSAVINDDGNEESSDYFSSDENPSSSSHNEHSPGTDITKKFPPPNPLPPKSLLPVNEPLKIGGNIFFL